MSATMQYLQNKGKPKIKVFRTNYGNIVTKKHICFKYNLIFAVGFFI